MPPARCRCCDETNYQRFPPHGLAPKGEIPTPSPKNHRRRESGFSIIFLSQSRRRRSEMSAEGGPIIHSPSTLVVPTGRPRSSGNREERAGGPSDIPLFLDHF